MSDDGWTKHETVYLPVWKPDIPGNNGEIVEIEGKQYIGGTSIEGLVTNVKSIEIDGKDKTLLNIKTSRGEIAVWCNAILQRKVREAGVDVDTMVKIVYLGTKKSKNASGRKYKDFDLYTK